jgi:hypothetical protein
MDGDDIDKKDGKANRKTSSFSPEGRVVDISITDQSRLNQTVNFNESPERAKDNGTVGTSFRSDYSDNGDNLLEQPQTKKLVMPILARYYTLKEKFKSEKDLMDEDEKKEILTESINLED